MKQKDYITIIVIGAVSAVLSLFVSNIFFGSKPSTQTQVQVVPTISDVFPTPDPGSFSSKSIDTTQLIQIGNSTNPNPFVTNGN